jgi:hypothetical protein
MDDTVNPSEVRNPTGWRWRLVLWLTGGELHAFNTAPPETGDLRIKLGRPGADNTAEEWTPETYEQWRSRHPGLSP